MSEPIVDARDLVKRYGAHAAVDGITLRVEPGEIFGLLGPNGSGKTTTILMLLGLTEPTSGTVRVAGHDPGREPLQVKRRVGYLPDAVGFYDHLSAEANLRYVAKLARLPRDETTARIRAAVERLGLGDVLHTRVGTFSRGMRQRLGLAEILLKRPALAILDEPTIGLDPEGAQELLALIRELKRDGLSVLLSSHLLDQVQAVCDRVALFHAGRIGLQGTLDELAIEVLGTAREILLEAAGPAVAASLADVHGIRRVERLDETHFRIDAADDVRPAIGAAIARDGGRLYSLALTKPSLEEIYARYFERVHRAA